MAVWRRGHDVGQLCSQLDRNYVVLWFVTPSIRIKLSEGLCYFRSLKLLFLPPAGTFFMSPQPPVFVPPMYFLSREVISWPWTSFLSPPCLFFSGGLQERTSRWYDF
jgi:hypothetical protein